MIYINQRKQKNWAGKLSGYRQCFYSAAVIFQSYFLTAITNWKTFYEEYVDSTEATVGKPGIAERLFPNLTGRTGAFWAVHLAAIKENVPFKNFQFKENLSFEELKKIIETRPAIIGTNKIGGLPGGHIIVAVRNAPGGVVVKDSYGNANTNYKDHNGDEIVIKDELLKKHFAKRAIYEI